MLCSKCHESIPKGKEIQIMWTIFCKECDLIIKEENKKEFVARCGNCNRTVYRGELIHKISRNDSKNWIRGLSLNLEDYEEVAQCDNCYQEWRNKVKKGEKGLITKGGILFFCLGVFLGLATNLFFPEIFKKMSDETLTTTFLFILLFIIILLSGPILSINRYEFKKKREK